MRRRARTGRARRTGHCSKRVTSRPSMVATGSLSVTSRAPLSQVSFPPQAGRYEHPVLDVALALERADEGARFETRVQFERCRDERPRPRGWLGDEGARFEPGRPFFEGAKQTVEDAAEQVRAEAR